MNIERAKQLLSGNMAALDPELERETAAALELLESSEELQQWMEQQEMMDPEIKDAIRNAPVPEGLEDKLLETVGARGNVKSHGTRWLAYASAIAAMLVFGTIFVRMTPQGEQLVQGMQKSVTGNSPDNYDHFRDSMSYYIRNVYFQLDHVTEDMNSIENWLVSNDAPVYEFVPEELLALNPIGCKELQWKGKDVSLVCFHTGDGNIIHMFILERDSVNQEAYEDINSVVVSNDLETGGWTTPEKVYILVGSAPGVDIEFALG